MLHKVKIQYAIQEIRVAEIEVTEKELKILQATSILSKHDNIEKVIMQKLENNKIVFHQHKFFELEGLQIL
jgi:hypothetical protein